MRRLVDRARIDRVMEAFALAADAPTSVYLVGGTTAVLQGWRDSTVDVDVVMRPENDALMREFPAIKERLEVNIELASPLDFIPVPIGWEDRSPLIRRIEQVEFRHFDLCAQALAKIERGHTQDMLDVREILDRGLASREQLRAGFAAIEPQLYRFPAVDPAGFRRAIEATAASR
ncbi:MAG: DUF6036 family nucleotidyltransferase [Gemmatimonadaceae bacterium]